MKVSTRIHIVEALEALDAANVNLEKALRSSSSKAEKLALLVGVRDTVLVSLAASVGYGIANLEEELK